MYFHMRASRHVRSALTEDMDAALAVNLFSHVWTTQTLFCSQKLQFQYQKASESPKHAGTDCSPKSPVNSSCIPPTLITLATSYLTHQIQSGNYYL